MTQSKINIYLRHLIMTGAFSVLLVPIFFNGDMFFPFIVFKNIIFRVIIEIIFAAYVILALRDPTFRPKRNALFLMVGMYFFIMSITTIFSLGIEKSIWGNYERMGGLFGMLHVLAYYIILVSLFQKREYWNSLFTFSIFTSVCMSLLTLAQKLNTPLLIQSSGGERLTGTIGNAIYLAAYMLFHIFFLLYFFLKDKDFDFRLFFWSVLGADAFMLLRDIYITVLYQGKGHLVSLSMTSILYQIIQSRRLWIYFLIFHAVVIFVFFFINNSLVRKGFLIFLLSFEILVIFWTQTRGVMLALLVGLLFMGVYGLWFQRKTAYAKWHAGIIIGVCFMLFGLYLGREMPLIKNIPMLERVSSISLTDITTQSRFLTWGATFQGWLENPFRFLFGYGLENFFVVFDRHFPYEIFVDSGSQIWFDRSHNIILDTGVTMGFIGLVVYCLILYAALAILYVNAKKKGNFAVSAVFSGLIVSYFLQNLFVFDTIDSFILFYLTLGFLTFLSLAHEQKIHWIENIFKKFSLPFRNTYAHAHGFLFVSCSLAILFIYFFNMRLVQANTLLFSTLKQSIISPDNVKTNTENFLKSINLAVTGRVEARQQFITYAVRAQNTKNVSEEDLRFVVNAAIRELEKTLEEEPHNVRNHILQASFYNHFAYLEPQYSDKTISIMQEAKKLSPSRPHIYFETGNAYFAKGNARKAIESFQEAVDIAPDIKGTRLALAFAYLRVSLFDEAQRQIRYIKNILKLSLTKDDYENLARIYEKHGKYDTIITFYKELAQREKSAEYYIKLAKTYALIGENEHAKEAMNEAIKIDTKRAEEAKIFFEDLRRGKLKKTK